MFAFLSWRLHMPGRRGKEPESSVLAAGSSVERSKFQGKFCAALKAEDFIYQEPDWSLYCHYNVHHNFWKTILLNLIISYICKDIDDTIPLNSRIW